MLMNHILMQEGYPPVVIARRHRKEYLEAMSTADQATKKNLVDVEVKYYQPLLAFIVEELEESYWDTFLT